MPAPRTGALPVGVQIIGPYLEDLTTIRVAELLSGG
jgi:Asp-tRNA(Asn)/Glu-tRNA(Gln) amidotransferase A subunit family amidase